jgi:small subunit ribosomal protein S1
VAVKTKSDKTPKHVLTMADLLASQKSTQKRFSLNEKVEGTIIEKLPSALIIDIGGKSEGMVAERAYIEAKNFIKHLNIGDKITGKVIVSENPEGYTILSLRDASKVYFWDKLEKLENDDEEISVTAKSVNPSGIIVDVFGLNGFIPTSHLGKEIAKNLTKIVGENFKVKIIELDRNDSRIVLSEKAVSEKEAIKEQKQAFKLIKEGDIFEGKVTTVTDFGVFVEIKAPLKKEKINLEGLVYISELSWEKVGKPRDKFKVGDKVKVKVIDIKEGRLSFSIKQASEDPWTNIQEKYKSEMRVKGIVSKKSDFGVFVILEPGVEGLIHMTKIPPGKKIREKDEVEVYIEDVDPEEKRISLGLVLTEKPVGYK